MTCRFAVSFIIFKHCFVKLFVLSGVQCDASDVGRAFLNHQPPGYVYSHSPVQFEEEPTHIYLPPLHPVFVDETPVIPAPYPPPEHYLPQSSFPVYLPPFPSNDADGIPPVQLPSPPDDDSIVIPALPPQNPGVYPPNQALLPPQFKIENMSCIQEINFKATFQMASDLSLFPVVDEAAEGCITSMNGNMFKIDLDNINNMLKCGVRRCKSNNVPQTRSNSVGSANSNVRGTIQESENMCVVLRMPTVRGVRLPEDQMVTLVCTPQERVVSRTKHVRLGSNKIFQNSRARSTNGFVATGGAQKDLKSRISIFRKRSGTNIFDQSVQPDSIIQLGEDLVLRTIISDVDGWQSSYIGPVLITGLKSKKSALLVNQHGCVNPVMKSICPQQPLRISPLSTELHFRAFLFQESPQGDEMVISVRMQACLHLQDCSRINPCRDDISLTRSKRELTELNNTSSNLFNKEIKNWESKLSFKVQPSSVQNQDSNFANSEEQGYRYLFFLTLGGVMLLSISVFIILMVWQLVYQER